MRAPVWRRNSTATQAQNARCSARSKWRRTPSESRALALAAFAVRVNTSLQVVKVLPGGTARRDSKLDRR